MKDHVVLAFGDIHAPYHWDGALDYIADQLRPYQKSKSTTVEVVFMGDEMDAHAFGRWPSDPDLYSPGHEWELGLEFMKQLYKVVKKAKVCKSNHTMRPWIQSFGAGIPKHFLKSINSAMHAPDSWVWDDVHVINNVRYIHGTGFSGQVAHIKACRRFFQSTVIGHIHAYAGVNYIQFEDKRFFGANAGCLIDQSALAFAYAKEMPEKASIGHLEVINGEQAFFFNAL